MESRFLSQQEFSWLTRRATRETVLQCEFGSAGILLRAIPGNAWAFKDLADKAVVDADYKAAIASAAKNGALP